ncbi:MAG: hypothetical protein HOO06_03275 [Bdellovibrionaceae bacterium]|jgi:hypothetical protein|nr:hypothetical protein [Pseudobdellovibrionaceae bacterium]
MKFLLIIIFIPQLVWGWGKQGTDCPNISDTLYYIESGTYAKASIDSMEVITNFHAIDYQELWPLAAKPSIIQHYRMGKNISDNFVNNLKEEFYFSHGKRNEKGATNLTTEADFHFSKSNLDHSFRSYTSGGHFGTFILNHVLKSWSHGGGIEYSTIPHIELRQVGQCEGVDSSISSYPKYKSIKELTTKNVLTLKDERSGEVVRINFKGFTDSGSIHIERLFLHEVMFGSHDNPSDKLIEMHPVRIKYKIAWDKDPLLSGPSQFLKNMNFRSGDLLLKDEFGGVIRSKKDIYYTQQAFKLKPNQTKANVSLLQGELYKELKVITKKLIFKFNEKSKYSNDLATVLYKEIYKNMPDVIDNIQLLNSSDGEEEHIYYSDLFESMNALADLNETMDVTPQVVAEICNQVGHSFDEEDLVNAPYLNCIKKVNIYDMYSRASNISLIADVTKPSISIEFFNMPRLLGRLLYYKTQSHIHSKYNDFLTAAKTEDLEFKDTDFFHLNFDFLTWPVGNETINPFR